MFRCAAVVLGLLVGLLAEPGVAAAKHKAIVIGDLAINPNDIVAVYRPVEQEAVAIFIGRPGHDIQTLVFRDAREAAAIFGEIWKSNDITKDPGDDDTRPLTRMKLKDAESKTITLIVNTERLLAVVRDSETRVVRVYFDRPSITIPMVDLDTGTERHYIEIRNIREGADNVMNAYKACIYAR